MPDKIRVCIICAGLPPFYGGAEGRAYRQAQRLQNTTNLKLVLVGWNRANDRTPVIQFPPYVYPVRLRLQLHSGDYDILRLTLHLAEIYIRLGWVFWRLRKDFDILHVVNGSPLFNLISIPIAKILNKTVVMEMTSLGSDDPLTLNKRSRHPRQQVFPHQPLKYSLFLKADNYISKSHALSEAYIQADLPASKLTQIPSGVDVARFKPPTQPEKDALRSRLETEKNKIIILFVGGIYELKGVHCLLEAFRVVALQSTEAHLWIVGPTAHYDSSYIQTIRENAVKWDLSSRVTFVSKQVDNVDEYMKAADIFALPSRREGMSNVILEAMSSGLAIVASDIPEIALSQIRNEVDGLLLPPDKPNQWANSLLKLVRDPEMRRKLGQAARQQAESKFNLEIVDTQYFDLYRRLSNSRSVKESAK
ncbi:glycosyltransferase family 4 protein [Chloroflexota bacterium]